jgi:hypothetical protein
VAVGGYATTAVLSAATAEHAAVAAHAASKLHGFAFGLLAATRSLGNLTVSGIAGLPWTLTSPTVAFGYAAVFMVAAAPLLTRAPEVRPRAR